MVHQVDQLKKYCSEKLVGLMWILFLLSLSYITLHHICISIRGGCLLLIKGVEALSAVKNEVPIVVWYRMSGVLDQYQLLLAGPV